MNLRSPKSLIILFLSISTFCNAQNHDKVFSVFLFSFIKYMSWPNNANKKEFVVGVIGSKEIVQELTKIAATKKINDLPIKVLELTTSESGYSSDLLFISSSNTSAIDNIVKKLGPSSVMVVGKDGYAKRTGGIDLFFQDGKVKFNINKAAIEKKDIKISTQMIELGNVI
ncbi:MAG: YfiR family protein [Flammeovirgaceae bacterium]